MKAIISYSEIQDVVAKMAGQQISLEYVAADTVRVTAMVKLKLFRVPVPLTLRVVEIQGNDIVLQYSGKIGVDLMVSGALQFIKAVRPEWVNMIDLQGNQTILLHLKRVEQLASVLDKVSLRFVLFTTEGVEAEITLVRHQLP